MTHLSERHALSDKIVQLESVIEVQNELIVDQCEYIETLKKYLWDRAEPFPEESYTD